MSSLHGVHGVTSRQVWEVTLDCGGTRCNVKRTVIHSSAATAALIGFDGWLLDNVGFTIPGCPVLLCPDCQKEPKR